MTSSTPHRIAIENEESILFVRQYCRNLSREAGFGLVDQTRITTVASELARNVYLYAGSGEAIIARVVDATRGLCGVEMVFRDKGPGIADVDRAMQQGFSTSGGLGLGLPGSKRLMDEFELQSAAEHGTTITVRKWL